MRAVTSGRIFSTRSARCWTSSKRAGRSSAAIARHGALTRRSRGTARLRGARNIHGDQQQAPFLGRDDVPMMRARLGMVKVAGVERQRADAAAAADHERVLAPFVIVRG